MAPVTAALDALPTLAAVLDALSSRTIVVTLRDSRPLVLLPGANGALGPLTTWRRAGQKHPEDPL